MCPYETWTRGYWLFCEAQRCSWIREPLNTLSNLGFIIAGIYILRAYSKVPQVRLIGFSAILVGILSAFYHATSSLIGENLDLGSMFLLICGLTSFNLCRLDLITIKGSERLACLLAVLSLILLFQVPGSGRPIFDTFILVTVSLELIIYFSHKRKRKPIDYSYKYFWLTLAFHLTAFLFWDLDRRRILCFPESLIFQGHALWHLLESFTFVCLARFYLQFSGRRT